MNKSELKTGMWVEMRDGRKAMVLLNTNNGDIVSSKETWFPIHEHWDESFNSKDIYTKSTSTEVVKVYQPRSNMAYTNSGLVEMELIWQRTEAKEITSEEAFSILKKHYGCEVKIKE